MLQQVQNSPQQAMMGDFPGAVEEAVIESMETHADLAKQFLSDKRVAKGFVELLMELVVKGLGDKGEGAQ